MAVKVITHKKVSNVPNGSNPATVQPSDWNDDHNIDEAAFVALIMPILAVTEGPYTAAALSGASIFTIYNTSGLPFTFNLPSEPAENQVVQVIDAGLTADADNIVINGNGNEVCAYGQAATSSVSIASDGGTISLAWDGIQWTQNG